MSLEGPKGPEKKRSGIVEAATVATALLGALDHGQAKAMEMPQGISWEKGMKENIRGAVMNEERENSAIYIRMSNGDSIWPAHYAGKEFKPGDKEASVTTMQSQEEIDFLSKRRGGTIEAYCQIHTHPHAYTFMLNGKQQSPAFHPPSSLDMQKEAGVEGFKRIFKLLNVNLKNYVPAVADSRGVWYYRTSDQAQFQAAALEKWWDAYGDFAVRSTLYEDFDFTTEYQMLRQAYQRYLGADVRFVSYDDLSKEPPCAGLDYVPGKINQPYEVKINPVQPKMQPKQIIPQPPATQMSRPSLNEQQNNEGRRRLDDQGPTIYNVGPPRR